LLPTSKEFESAKVIKMIETLKQIRSKDATTKTIVFSQVSDIIIIIDDEW
jgi:hypothetical protein